MAGRIVARAEPLYLIAIAPLLLFPTFRPAWTALGLAGLVIVWVARAILRRELWPVTPFNVALLVFCVAIPLAVWASPVPDLTLPKLTGLILGLGAFRAVAFAARDRRGLMLALAILAVAGAAIWVLGLLGMRLPLLQPISARLPAALVSLPGAEQGINPNQLAGALVFLLPLLICCAWGFFAMGQRILAAALAVAGLAALAALALTQSRAGWVGTAAALLTIILALLWLRVGPKARRTIAVGACVAAIIAIAAGAIALPRVLLPGEAGLAGKQGVDTLQQPTLEVRIEIWSRAVYALQDFPFTGVGLGAFRQVVNVLYPLFLVAPDFDIAHSHNMFLQAGVDLGLIGLAGYVALLLVGAMSAWQVAATRRSLERYVAVGALAALVGLHVYGLADALALGSKPSAVFWVVMGIVAGLAARPHDAGPAL